MSIAKNHAVCQQPMMYAPKYGMPKGICQNAHTKSCTQKMSLCESMVLPFTIEWNIELLTDVCKYPKTQNNVKLRSHA